MTYKTLTLGIYRPSAHKRAIIDRALLSYSRALEYLLAENRPLLEDIAAQHGTRSRRELVDMACPYAPQLNRFGAQPFKDALKLEFAARAAAYLNASRTKATGFPHIYVDPDEVPAALKMLAADFDSGLIRRAEYERRCSALLARSGRLHPLYFGRYSILRDYCLLYDEFSGRFYAKLTLMNSSGRERAAEGEGKLSLRCVAPGMPALPNTPGKRSYIVVPLAFGKREQKDLMRALKDPSLLRTARLVQRGGGYCLLVNFACPAAEQSRTVLGLARSLKGGVRFAVYSEEKITASGDITGRDAHALAKACLMKAARWKAQTVLEAGGGKNDGADGAKDARPVSAAEYSLMASLLSYRLPDAGLPAPVEVSSAGLYHTCPACGKKTSRNIVSDRIFACVECGFAAPLEEIGARSLALRLARYASDRVPVYISAADGVLVCRNKRLGFECTVPDEGGDLSRLYYELSLFVRAETGYIGDRTRYAMLRKLRQADDIRKVLRIVRRG
jgi:putative transposase